MPGRFSSEEEIRSLLELVDGVGTVAVRTDPDGSVREIEIDAAPSENPKRIVRDVESALYTGLGMQVDHRVIQIYQNGGLLESAQSLHPEGSDPGRSAAANRPDLVGVRCEPDGELYCEVFVELRYDDEWFSARAREADTPEGRLVAAGRAALESLQATLEKETAFTLEGAEELEIADSRAILSSVQVKRGRTHHTLLGMALVENGPEEAAARAALDALNRYWAAQDHASAS